jgi:hypothetical protein
MTERLYIFTRQDLRPGYQAVQSCHSVVFMNATNLNWDGTMILLAARDEEELTDLLVRMDLLGRNPEPFYEPDVNFQLTSFSVMLPEYDWVKFSHLPLALSDNTTFRGWLRGKFRNRFH